MVAMLMKLIDNRYFVYVVISNLEKFCYLLLAILYFVYLIYKLRGDCIAICYYVLCEDIDSYSEEHRNI